MRTASSVAVRNKTVGPSHPRRISFTRGGEASAKGQSGHCRACRKWTAVSGFVPESGPSDLPLWVGSGHLRLTPLFHQTVLEDACSRIQRFCGAVGSGGTEADVESAIGPVADIRCPNSQPPAWVIGIPRLSFHSDSMIGVCQSVTNHFCSHGSSPANCCLYSAKSGSRSFVA